MTRSRIEGVDTSRRNAVCGGRHGVGRSASQPWAPVIARQGGPITGLRGEASTRGPRDLGSRRMAGVMWQPYEGPGAERAVVESTPDGHRIAGTSLLVAAASTHEIRYTILVDPGWRTRTVGAHVQGPGADRRLALHADGSGTWSVGDAPLVDLFGAIDVDLAWTPATNTLPIRRLDLAVGDSAEIIVARIAFPDHDVARRRQRYTRLTESTYRLETEGDAVDLVVDQVGVVTEYPGGWRAVAQD